MSRATEDTLVDHLEHQGCPWAPEEGPLREVLADFLETLTRKLDVERASLMLHDPDSGELVVAASQGIDDVDISTVRVPAGRGVSGFVFETGETFLVQNASKDGRLAGPNYPHLAESFLSAPIELRVPIRSKRQILGVVNVTNRRGGEPLGPRDAAYLRALAGQLATAIEAARRSDQLHRAYRSLQSNRDDPGFSERMHTVGQMAAGVAHEFNNALSVILGRAQFVAEQLEQPEIDRHRIMRDLEAVIGTALHAASVVKRMQDYTRIDQEPLRRGVDLCQIVRDALEVAREGWPPARREAIDVVLDLAPAPPVAGEAYELGQVVENLVENAVDAMPAGGRLEVRTRVEGDDRVALDIRDEGAGMDEEGRARIFEPFFTTKKGSQGLGASVVYGIVTRSGGALRVRSEPGAGTTLTVELPVVLGATPTPPSPVETSPARATGHVLIVDDDDLVRETYEEALRMGGHSVCGCPDARSALAQAGRESFDLVITDLSMGGMSGLELATELKRDRPDLPVILLSGWALDQEDSKVREAGIDRVLVKPCLVEQLLSVVKQSLGS